MLFPKASCSSTSKHFVRHARIHGLRHSCRYMHFPQGSIQLNTFRASVFRCLPFRKALGGRRSPPPPEGNGVCACYHCPLRCRCRGGGGSVLGLAAPSASPGYGLLQGTAGDHCSPSNGRSCALLRDCLSTWATLWSRGFRPEPLLAGEPGPVPRKEIRRSLVILEQGSDQSESPVELNGRLRQAPVVKRMGSLVAGRFVVMACGEAVR